MKARLIQALIVALISAIAGVGVTFWLKSNQMVGIVIASSLMGFFFGLIFKFHLL